MYVFVLQVDEMMAVHVGAIFMPHGLGHLVGSIKHFLFRINFDSDKKWLYVFNVSKLSCQLGMAVHDVGGYTGDGTFIACWYVIRL